MVDMNPSWVPVLCYHRVCPEKDFGKVRSICVRPENFRAQMRCLKDLGFTALSVQTFVHYLRLQKNIPSRSVVITFDDGYQDNFTYAVPILKQFGFTANIFLVTDRIGKTNAWDEENIPLLTEDQIKEMRDQGMVFGSHTASHMDMTKAEASRMREELERSRKKIEDLTWRRDIPFCYPYSRFNQDTKRRVREAGYLCGLAMDAGPWDQTQDLFEMSRVQVFPSTSLFGFWKKIQSWYPRWAEFQKRLKAQPGALKGSPSAHGGGFPPAGI